MLRGLHKSRQQPAALLRLLLKTPQAHALDMSGPRFNGLHMCCQDERRRGRAVRALRFGDTPHCGHFRRHRAEYTLALQRFLSQDLKAGPWAVFLVKLPGPVHAEAVGCLFALATVVPSSLSA